MKQINETESGWPAVETFLSCKKTRTPCFTPIKRFCFAWPLPFHFLIRFFCAYITFGYAGSAFGNQKHNTPGCSHIFLSHPDFLNQPGWWPTPANVRWGWASARLQDAPLPTPGKLLFKGAFLHQRDQLQLFIFQFSPLFASKLG